MLFMINLILLIFLLLFVFYYRFIIYSLKKQRIRLLVRRWFQHVMFWDLQVMFLMKLLRMILLYQLLNHNLIFSHNHLKKSLLLVLLLVIVVLNLKNMKNQLRKQSHSFVVRKLVPSLLRML